MLAPTGAAARNIDGTTIHSGLRILINGNMSPLNGENLRNSQLHFQKIRFIIIDKYSMVGTRLLCKIHRRLCEAKANSQEPFGGLNGYLFGDIRQLPPVKDTAIYMHSNSVDSNLGSNLVSSILRVFILTECHRQSSDQIEFREILDTIADGTVTPSGRELLMSRRMSILLRCITEFQDAVQLFPTNLQVDDHNKNILASTWKPVALIEAWHNNATARQADDQQAQGLHRTLYLSHDCRIMLRKNLSVERGFVNGSLGTLRKIVYRNGERPPTMPYILLVEFDNFDGPYLMDRSFPLKPCIATWKDHGVDCARMQFPINLAYALTIHKAQGLTLD